MCEKDVSGDAYPDAEDILVSSRWWGRTSNDEKSNSLFLDNSHTHLKSKRINYVLKFETMLSLKTLIFIRIFFAFLIIGG